MQITVCKNCLLQLFHLVFQTCRQYGKTHNLNQTNIFFLDMMKVRMRMVNAQRMFLRRNVIPKHQIQFKLISLLTGNRGNGVVLFAICLGIDKSCLICIAAPCIQDHIGKGNDSLRILCLQADYRHRPLHNTCLHILITRNDEFFFNRSLRHREFMVSTLKMIVCQNRSTNNREIRIRSQNIVWKLLHKIKQLAEGIVINLHRYMLSVKHDTVLIIINIGRILESPLFPIDLNGNNAVILSCRMIDPACISFVFTAEQTFRISSLLHQLRCCDCLRVLLWLRKVDRNG